MSPETDFWLNAASASGIAILSVPAFSLNFRKRTLARITRVVRRRKPGQEKSALDTIAQELEKDVTDKANRWRRVDEICLFIGYVLLLGSAVTRVVLTWS